MIVMSHSFSQETNVFQTMMNLRIIQNFTMGSKYIHQLSPIYTFWHGDFLEPGYFGTGTFRHRNISAWGHYGTGEYWHNDISAHGCFSTGKFWHDAKLYGCFGTDILASVQKCVTMPKRPFFQNINVPKCSSAKMSLC